MTEIETKLEKKKEDIVKVEETMPQAQPKNVETKLDDKKVEPKKESPKHKEKEKPKKTKAIINVFDVPVSTKHSTAICRFIKGKKIPEAIRNLELVAKMKNPIPMKGEIPHRHGKGIMSGRFPQKAARQFIILLKSLSANSIHNGLENPVITEAVANIGSRPFGRGGIRRKRTHIRIVAEEKKALEGSKK